MISVENLHMAFWLFVCVVYTLYIALIIRQIGLLRIIPTLGKRERKKNKREHYCKTLLRQAQTRSEFIVDIR